MIEKKAGNSQLNKLRTIHLFEADHYWLLGVIFGRRMVHGAEKQDHLHEGQWCSRPGRSAHDALLHKILTYEVARMTRTPLATFDNDAKSCYDRIIVVCQKHGVPQSVCMMAAMSLMTPECSIKTKHGVSLDTCSSTEDNPTHGPGQGSCMAPALWLIICCLLFEAMSNLCQGAEFCNPRQTSSHRRIGDGFVDDVTNFFNFGLAAMLLHEHGPIELAKGLKTEAQTWERLLCSTGGQLKLPKCLHCLMMFDFHPVGAPTHRPATDMGTDLIQMTTGASLTSTEIEHRDCSKAHRTLGLHPAPTGCQLTQANELRLKSDHFAAGLGKAPLTKYEARTACWMMRPPSMTYCLPCSCMTKTQLYHIQKKMTSSSLLKRGHSSKTQTVPQHRRSPLVSRARHSWDSSAPQAHQVRLQARHLPQDCPRLDPTPHRSFLSDSRKHPHLEQGWFPATRTFLGSINANVPIPNRVLPSLL
jgi:hypothetical protein